MIHTTRDLLAQGYNHQDIARLVSDGKLLHVRRGAYSDPMPPGITESPADRHRRLLSAAMARFERPVVASHISAGVLHDLPLPQQLLNRAHVIKQQASGSGVKLTARTYLRREIVPASDLVTLDNTLSTSLERTVADLVCSLSAADAIAVVDAGLARGLTKERLLARLENKRHRGVREHRRWVRFGDPRAESRGESVSRWLMAEHGIPAPELQFHVCDGRYRCDFGWPAFNVVGEFDGATKYDELLKPGQSPKDRVMAEKRRDLEIGQAGWWPVHWGWKNLRPPTAFAAMLRETLALGARIK